ncbi:MAG TPA: 2-amino-4-hydroxy-6-hydroxymethyldihydropteridine diphosphokinase, partial [Arenimonas sp.]|nr:2-amino-4-hydroxy-6-hydroxymethyldihydropteridine diphosphokinase [Arenimonas sp.]
MTDWLLLLGSNHVDDGPIGDALEALATIGEVDCLCRRHLPPRSGRGAWYFNALATLSGDGSTSADALRARLRDIEQRLGRDRDDPQRVHIDIDILALRDEEWVAEAHAMDKGELEGFPVAMLLAETGLKIR